MIKKILLLHEKHGYSVHDITTGALMDMVYLSIFNQRKAERYYSDLSIQPFFDHEKFKDLKNGKLARRFILWRSDQGYEYERVEELQIQKLRR